ncbi:prephenate dehydrogenase/arogenate dehydrogenase family protein [Actinoplanes sp. LDG1-06]|uniref:Prephenate dehydrogenase/arogenate dehydrogenase family protein n=1 Tax=Paractinoplanes ovalisporus TaxID=2810368 RepID=A0ABS2ABB0_9ACTN|nr:prephenate dehydrogenase/arogenate dehydrogenase family protein [Actinoplanes ovalisporus]MBM2617115.1 prephenate dehydrogenase/arogenate dehydrogenase family protein [Actinoplanes ovalisporus]
MNIAVVGLGLIGGSLLRALDAGGHDVVGFDADPVTREAATAAGFRVGADLQRAVAGAELVVLAVPLPALPSVIGELADHPGLVTDVTSVKQPVRDLAAKHGVRRFVGGHPMAGKETSGFAATDARLFDGCAWVLCLEPGETSLTDWLLLADLFTRLGARVVPIEAGRHDRAVAQVSHVPHLFAAALAGQLRDNPPAATLAAGSFRDGTRVAATRAELIAAMCGGNAAAVGAELDRLLAELHEMRALLDEPDPVAALTPALRPAGELRRAWPPAPGPSAELPGEAAALLELGRAGGWVTAVAGDRSTVSSMRPESGCNRP